MAKSRSAAKGSGGAPTTADYVLLATNGSLSNERVLTEATDAAISITDGGAGNNVTIGVDINGKAGDGSGITVASDDEILIADKDDSYAIKKVTISQIPVGSPAGASGQVQYNNSDAFGGADNLTFDGDHITVGSTDADARLNFGDTGTYIHQSANAVFDCRFGRYHHSGCHNRYCTQRRRRQRNDG